MINCLKLQTPECPDNWEWGSILIVEKLVVIVVFWLAYYDVRPFIISEARRY